MNDLQKIEFDLLNIFIGICDKLDLKYYLVCGSALGAVKYNGFIPWDDDIDVALPRAEYNIFLEKAPQMLPDNIFLQNYSTDPLFPQIYSKLRNSNTTFIEKSAAKLNINHGIFIDIFPLDGYPEGAFEQKLFEIKKKIYNFLILSVYDVDRHGLSKLLNGLLRAFKINKKSNKLAKKYEKLISGYSCEKSGVLCNHGNWQGKLDYSPLEHFGDGVMFNFEGLDVRVPKKFNDYLSQKYGDYTAELPADKQKSHHNIFACDCKKSYKNYIDERS